MANIFEKYDNDNTNRQLLIAELDKYGGIKSTIEKLNQKVDRLRNEVTSLQAQKETLGRQIQATNSNLVYSKQSVDFCNGVVESLTNEILRMLSIVAFIIYLYNDNRQLQQPIRSDVNLQKFIPLIKADRGESVPTEELRMSVTKAIDIMINVVTPTDKSLAKALSDARVALAT